MQQELIQANTIAQSAIGRCDLRAQIQKFWKKCSNLNFKENSFNPFQSFSGQKKLRN